jgi:hypothetical protein
LVTCTQEASSAWPEDGPAQILSPVSPGGRVVTLEEQA